MNKENINSEAKKHISITNYLRSHNDGRYDPSKYSHRNKFLDYLEDNEFFGIDILSGEEIGNEYDKKEEYIAASDIPFLDFKSIQFFEDFGYSEKEKVWRILNSSSAEPSNVKLIKEFIEWRDPDRGPLYTPSFTSFVSIVSDNAPILEMNNNDISDLLTLGNEEYAETMKFMIEFLNSVRRNYGTDFGDVRMPVTKSKPVPAYSEEELILLASMLFGETYDKEHGLTEKALENHRFAEMWLFLAVHYVASMRASDLCTTWAYPNIEDKNNPFGIDPATLKEDILNDKIKHDTLVKIANYSIDKSYLEFHLTGKTGKGRSSYEIDDVLKEAFGKLTLIAEYHHYTDGEGYMKPRRIPNYTNWTSCQAFFGEKYIEIFGRRNLRSIRLNKSNLQGNEEIARKRGKGSLEAFKIASYARRHSDLSSLLHYVRDRHFSRETADVALYFMMQQGIQSAYLYRSLVTAFPETFGELSLKDRSEIMQKIDISALELELAGAEAYAADSILQSMIDGNEDGAAAVLKAMSSICLNGGNSKQHGVKCLRTSLGHTCDRKSEYCIDTLCPYHVLTNQGIPTLVERVLYYIEKYKETGNVKYYAVLEQKVIPRYKNVLIKVLEDMTPTQSASIKNLIGELVANE